MPLDESFCESAIIRCLCRLRIAKAESERQRRALDRFLASGSTAFVQHPAPSQTVYSLLPPRRTWNKFRRRVRHRQSDGDATSLLNATLTLRVESPHLPWAVNLETFIQEVRQRVLTDQNFQFEPPSVRWELKDGSRYRAISRFSLQDSVINTLLARYLSELLDPTFEPNSFAFRARRPDGRKPTHHDAFDELYRFKRCAGDIPLYVAECDIAGFFDAVDHTVALRALDKAEENLISLNPAQRLDQRARRAFVAYLNCYSFPQNVLAETEPRLRAEVNDPKAHFPWPEEKLRRFHTQPRDVRIGVPQGGALSGIIANLMLDQADKRVRELVNPVPDQVTYLRFCDDMILVTRDCKECEKIFAAYLQTLDSLHLPYHQPTRVWIYGRELWEGKSKAPYCWTGRKFFNCVPWVQFVGYQVRYDGLVRVKPKSLAKQIKKMVDCVGETKASLLRLHPGQTVRASAGQVFQFLVRKITAQGVGRIPYVDGPRGPRSMCWANGFRALDGKPFIGSVLRKLDRNRERQIKRFQRAPIVYGQGTPGRGRSREQRVRFLGRPFSYAGQFENRGGADLIKNPYVPGMVERYLLGSVYGFCKWMRDMVRK